MTTKRFFMFVILAGALSSLIASKSMSNLDLVFASDVSMVYATTSPGNQRYLAQFNVSCNFFCSDRTMVGIFPKGEKPWLYKQAIVLSLRGLHDANPRWDGEGRAMIDIPAIEDVIISSVSEYDGVAIVFNQLPPDPAQ